MSFHLLLHYSFYIVMALVVIILVCGIVKKFFFPVQWIEKSIKDNDDKNELIVNVDTVYALI